MKNFVIIILFFLSTTIQSQILNQRERAAAIDMVLKDRFDNLLPQLMDRTGFDMWILISREYNEDPVLKTMLPSTWLNARRRTILVFYRDKAKNTIEKLAVARYNVGKNIDSAWDKDEQPDQWKALIDIISKRDPKKIGINYSKDFGILDGIVKTDYDELMNVLPEEYKSRISSAEKLSIAWVETRTQQEMEIYKELVKITHDIIDEAFSTSVIQPGTTTTDDVVWWLRQKVTDMGLKTWFHPTVDIQRSGEALQSHIVSFSDRPKDKVIRPGDLIHCDFGITYLRLNTDCQQHAYILKNGEISPPEFLTKAFADGNKVQDIFTSNFKTGKTGNEILLKSLEQAKAEGLKPSIYTHPLGVFGHSAGPTIGMWDAQGGVPGTGDYPLYENTVYAIELNTTITLPEWKKDIRIMLEEAGFWGTSGFKYVNDRQTELITIPKRK
ncbi:Xaa-Pro aminopeptidase [Aquimarina sp. EL_43]|uniref:M24 family metallopeptidase n=1 Tax=unclassified Aquimarina TaxID=2627091 RepID=UPI0018C90A53|nr:MULTISPECIES: M24 family metallopeptidase [unclassified Aquimarina]MBG6129358.1 Xaa-Pro aminopeptidase [Aquimarina sp. EL_35]MBG6150423.1 Xaa-Pro aminopeptidase [Aquimarina sp. EL_32]MBG6168269.1 Xaa-Pro aminopeptidase [Aquimarina sp. EL_43]